MKDVFGFAEHQKKLHVARAYTLTLRRIIDNKFLSHRPGAGATVAGRRTASEAREGIFHIIDENWSILLFTPNILQQKLMLQQVVSRSAAELADSERFVYNEHVSVGKHWTFQ